MQNKSKRRLFKSRIAIGLLGFMLCTPSHSLGWGAGGHMMVAYIAYQRLNPRAKTQVDKLLEIPIEPAEVTALRKDFVTASTWADDVRRLPGFEYSADLHFIDQPFSTDGTKLPLDLPETGNQNNPRNVVEALEYYESILRSSTNKRDQAQALRFIIHFVGDIHQPLHCATRVDITHPEGDQGGNQIMILMPTLNAKKITRVNLHSYWDGGLNSFPKTGPNFTPPPLDEIPAAAAKAMAGNPDIARARFAAPFDFAAWANESKQLAQTVAYKNITAGQEPSAAYKVASLKVVRQRVAWAGYRLAALLNAIWPK